MYSHDWRRDRPSEYAPRDDKRDRPRGVKRPRSPEMYDNRQSKRPKPDPREYPPSRRPRMYSEAGPVPPPPPEYGYGRGGFYGEREMYSFPPRDYYGFPPRRPPLPYDRPFPHQRPFYEHRHRSLNKRSPSPSRSPESPGRHRRRDSPYDDRDDEEERHWRREERMREERRREERRSEERRRERREGEERVLREERRESPKEELREEREERRARVEEERAVRMEAVGREEEERGRGAEEGPKEERLEKEEAVEEEKGQGEEEVRTALNKEEIVQAIKRLDVEIKGIASQLEAARTPSLRTRTVLVKRRRRKEVPRVEEAPAPAVEEEVPVEEVQPKADAEDGVGVVTAGLARCVLSVEERILEENRARAQKAAALLAPLCPGYCVGVYSGTPPSELAVVALNARTHAALAPRIASRIRPRAPRPAPTVPADLPYAPIPALLTLEEREREVGDGAEREWDPVGAWAAQRRAETAWTTEEEAIFTTRFVEFPKDTRRIAEGLPRQNVHEVVALYYRVRHSASFMALMREHQVKRNYGRRLVAEGPRNPTYSTALSALGDMEITRELRSLGVMSPSILGTGRSRRGREGGRGGERDGEEEEGMRWTEDEKALFVVLLRELGKDFDAIATRLGTKTQSQCKNYFHNNKRRLNFEDMGPQRPKQDKKKARKTASRPTSSSTPAVARREPWTDREREAVVRAVAAYGTEWRRVEEAVPGRSVQEIKDLCKELDILPARSRTRPKGPSAPVAELPHRPLPELPAPTARLPLEAAGGDGFPSLHTLISRSGMATPAPSSFASHPPPPSFTQPRRSSIQALLNEPNGDGDPSAWMMFGPPRSGPSSPFEPGQGDGPINLFFEERLSSSFGADPSRGLPPGPIPVVFTQGPPRPLPSASPPPMTFAAAPVPSPPSAPPPASL